MLPLGCDTHRGFILLLWGDARARRGRTAGKKSISLCRAGQLAVMVGLAGSGAKGFIILWCLKDDPLWFQSVLLELSLT